MAPYIPEEVDVFTGPHSRMKDLVNDYVEMLETTNFSNFADLKLLLDSLRETFKEFKLHEQIENTLIMKRLKKKLKQLSIKNKFVCNCHKDTHLTDMLTLVQEGFGKKNDQDRLNYSLQLKKSLHLFTEVFLPHMKQEEEIFQPLLLKYFTYEELCELKRKVIDFHTCNETDVIEKGLFEEAEKEEASEYPCSDVEEEEEEDYDENCHNIAPQTSVNDLPPELLTHIFTYLNPREVGQCRQVCQQWQPTSLDSRLWTEFHPTKWANGDWSAKMRDLDYELDEEEQDELTLEDDPISWNYSVVIDDDADVDESEPSDSEGDPEQSDYSMMVQRQRKILLGMVKFILPSVGHSVKVLNLGHCHALTNVMLQNLLKHTPNVEYLNLAGTRISDNGLKCIGKHSCGEKLRHLNLSGCANVTDATLERVSQTLTGVTANDNGVSQQLVSSCWCNKPHTADTISETNDSILHPKSDINISAISEYNTNANENSQDICGANDSDNKMLNTGPDGWFAEHSSDSGTVLVDGGNRRSSGDGHQRSTDSCHINCGHGQPARPTAEPDPIEDCARPLCIASAMLLSPNENLSHPCALPPYADLVDRSIDGITLCQKGLPFEEDRFAAKDHKPEKCLTYLNLSGCHQLTDYSMRTLAEAGPLPHLTHLDLSGCMGVSGAGIAALAAACPALEHESFFYCDNIIDGPYADTASGCQNVCCSARVCCRKGY